MLVMNPNYRKKKLFCSFGTVHKYNVNLLRRSKPCLLNTENSLIHGHNIFLVSAIFMCDKINDHHLF